MMSFTSSVPIDSRTKSGVTPVLFCSSGDSCWCVVLLGWMISDLLSPMLARCEKSFTLLISLMPFAVCWVGVAPAMPKPNTAPVPRGMYFLPRE